MISRIPFCPYSKPLSTLSSAPSAACARLTRLPPSLLALKVCLKLTWPMTYSKRPGPRSTSPNSSTVSTPPSASPSIAKASSLPSPRRSPAKTASCVPTRTPSPCARSHDDAAGCLLGYRRRLALGVSPNPHLPARRTPSPGWAGLLGTPLPLSHHLDQRRPAAQLERRVLSAFSL